MVAELGGAVGALAGYAAAVPTTLFLLEQGVRDEFNVLLTYGVKNALFATGNLVTFGFMHANPLQHLGQLVRSNLVGLSIAASLSLVGHYTLLKTQAIRPALAPIVVYFPAALIGSGYRHYRNHQKGILRSPSESLDDLCEH
ncbi:MAG: hypothetical protein AABX70_06880 [Nanoarchaeota archaeon]